MLSEGGLTLSFRDSLPEPASKNAKVLSHGYKDGRLYYFVELYDSQNGERKWIKSDEFMEFDAVNWYWLHPIDFDPFVKAGIAENIGKSAKAPSRKMKISTSELCQISSSAPIEKPRPHLNISSSDMMEIPISTSAKMQISPLQNIYDSPDQLKPQQSKTAEGQKLKNEYVSSQPSQWAATMPLPEPQVKKVGLKLVGIPVPSNDRWEIVGESKDNNKTIYTVRNKASGGKLFWTEGQVVSRDPKILSEYRQRAKNND